MNFLGACCGYSRENRPSPTLPPNDVKEKQAEECAICLDPKFVNERSIVTTPCGHSYHADCFDQLSWKKQKKCPICRRQVDIALAEFSGISNDENVSNKNNLSPALLLAAKNGHAKTLKLLIKEGAEVN